MGNLNKTKYNLIEIYSNFQQSELDNNNDSNFPSRISSNKVKNPAEVVNSNINRLAKGNKLADNSINNLVHIIKDSCFDSLCLFCIANKQTQVVIRNKPITKIDDKLDKAHVNFWGLHYPTSIRDKTYTIIILDIKT